MKAVYPIIMTKCDRNYCPYFIDIPDFKCSIHAEDVLSGMDLARKRICSEIEKLQATNQPIPTSNYVIPTDYRADIVTLIDIDTEEKPRIQKQKRLTKFLNIRDN